MKRRVEKKRAARRAHAVRLNDVRWRGRHERWIDEGRGLAALWIHYGPPMTEVERKLAEFSRLCLSGVGVTALEES